jgi:ribosomal protein S18 acetylase RimI-like enzyme
LYEGYLEDENSGLLVAEDGGAVMGFVAYSFDYSGFYRMLMRRHAVRFALCASTAVVRHPSIIGRLFGAFGKSESVARDEKYVELASICVDPSCEGKGIGSALIESLIDLVDFDYYKYICLETDATNNDRANAFYEKNDFKLERIYQTKQGRLMNEYRYYK